jgi:fido (protein-threonine AMPylation protein)
VSKNHWHRTYSNRTYGLQFWKCTFSGKGRQFAKFLREIIVVHILCTPFLCGNGRQN